MTPERRIGTLVAGALAFTTTWAVAEFLALPDVETIWWVVQPLIALCGWIGAWAWARSRNGVSALSHLAVLAAPWGYLIEIAGPVALGLVVAAGVAGIRGRTRKQADHASGIALLVVGVALMLLGLLTIWGLGPLVYVALLPGACVVALGLSAFLPPLVAAVLALGAEIGLVLGGASLLSS